MPTGHPGSALERTQCSKGHRLTDENTMLERSPHGGVYARCRRCERANNKRKRERNADAQRARSARAAAKLQAELAADPDDPRHGREGSYSKGKCRCQRCRQAANDAQNLRRLKARAKAAGVDIDALLSSRGRAPFVIAAHFEDRGGYMGQVEDPVLEEVLRRVS